MIVTKSDIADQISKFDLLTIEVDDRHMALINELFLVGVLTGKQIAKDAIKWRANGQLWCDFIDKGETDANA